MTAFDLLFIILFFVLVFFLLAAVWFASRKQFDRAGRILKRILIFSAVYFTIVVSLSLISPRQEMKPGDRQCFDDMCVSVNAYQRILQGSAMKYRVEMELFNRGRGVSQRENNLVMYLTDDQGRRYDPVPDSTYPAFNALLKPNESILVNRSYLIPQGVQGISAVIAHEGGFPIGWFIIGYDSWFRKPPQVPLA